MSGLKVNYSKSLTMSWSGNERWVEEMSSLLKCSHGKLPMTYLWMPLGGDSSKSKFWSPVLDKIKSRPSLWQRRFLCTVGRTELIRLVLSNLPTYILSLFKNPDTVAKMIMKLERNFFWSG